MSPKYTGTKGMTPTVALNRLKELFEKYKLNEQDDLYLQECLDLLDQEIPELMENNKWWIAIEENLTAKQLLKARKELMKK